MATTISLDALRDLAAFRAGSGCAISLYVDLDPSDAPTARDVATRVRSLLHEGQRCAPTDLGHDERVGLKDDLRRMQAFFDSEFDRDGARGYAVFAAGGDGVWQTLSLASAVPDAIELGGEFHLAPLVPFVGRDEGALVAVVGRERGSLYDLRNGRLTELVDLAVDALRRHDQGGWSQANYQRHVDEQADAHYREVADELERRFRRLGRPRIVVVAPEAVRPAFADELGHDVSEAVIGWPSTDAHATLAQLEAVVTSVLEDWRATEEAACIERWREEVGRSARGTAGWSDTLEAASDGRVELLLYAVGVSHRAARCPRCGRVQADGDVCPLDGETLEASSQGLDLAVRQTLAHGGAVWAVRHRQDLEPVGGIGAILRF
jgi:peptide chain release factor subunit 1